MYWSEMPFALQRSAKMRRDEYFPVLHSICADTDLLIVSRADCGHVAVDVELRESLSGTERILVSLPLLARWYSSCGAFNAEEMLRESGKFDYSEPQFFHTFVKAVRSDDEDSGDIVVCEHKLDANYELKLCCEFETPASKNLWIDSPLSSRPVYACTS